MKTMTHRPIQIHRHGQRAPETAYVLDYRVTTDTREFYTLKRPSLSSRREVRAMYWIPNHPGPLTIAEKADITRGKQFFSVRDGFLLGARVSLLDSGTIVCMRLDV